MRPLAGGAVVKPDGAIAFLGESSPTTFRIIVKELARQHRNEDAIGTSLPRDDDSTFDLCRNGKNDNNRYDKDDSDGESTLSQQTVEFPLPPLVYVGQDELSEESGEEVNQTQDTNGDKTLAASHSIETQGTPHKKRWENMFVNLVQYLKKHREWPTTRENKPLYSWVLAQRKRKREEKFKDDQFELLHELGFPWEGPLSRATYYPEQAQSPEEHFSINEWQQDNDSENDSENESENDSENDSEDDSDNGQQEEILLYGEIHPDVIQRELAWLGIPMDDFQVERTNDGREATNERKRKRTKPNSSCN